MSLLGALTLATMIAVGPSQDRLDVRVVETRTVELLQTVTLHDIPAGAGSVRMWVPIPTDGPWQRVLDRDIVAAPGGWELVPQEGGRGEFVFVDVPKPAPGDLSVSVRCVVERKAIHFPLETATAGPSSLPQSNAIRSRLFVDSLDLKAPLMEADDRVKALADKACGDERDPSRQALLLLRAVSESADHYSKDKTKPTCGRGAASDCIDHGGGCCTDLHSLFIAMARSRGLPARIQFGYRLLDAKAGAPFDPGYRCWTEFFLPGAGWIPTDIVAADNSETNPLRWASLSATRVALWQGRSFELTPKSNGGRVDTMLVGWAEIDGKSVDPLPAQDGTPSKLRRTVQFTVLETDRKPDTARLPE